MDHGVRLVLSKVWWEIDTSLIGLQPLLCFLCKIQIRALGQWGPWKFNLFCLLHSWYFRTLQDCHEYLFLQHFGNTKNFLKARSLFTSYISTELGVKIIYFMSFLICYFQIPGLLLKRLLFNLQKLNMFPKPKLSSKSSLSKCLLF